LMLVDVAVLVTAANEPMGTTFASHGWRGCALAASAA
jgi:hypothetical protein